MKTRLLKLKSKIEETDILVIRLLVTLISILDHVKPFVSSPKNFFQEILQLPRDFFTEILVEKLHILGSYYS